MEETCLQGAQGCDTVGEAEVGEGFRSMARADQSPAQASCCGDKGSQALDKQGSGVGMGWVVGRGTTQPSSQKGGAEMDAEDNLCGMEDVGDKGEGASTSNGSAGEDGAADAKRGHVQGMGLVA